MAKEDGYIVDNLNIFSEQFVSMSLFVLSKLNQVVDIIFCMGSILEISLKTPEVNSEDLFHIIKLIDSNRTLAGGNLRNFNRPHQ